MKTNIRVIDLAKYKAKDSKFIIGRENGANAMVKEDLKNFVKKVENKEINYIKIEVSKEIYGIVSSFLLGFFADIVADLKSKERFYEVFNLSDLQPEIKKQIDEEIDFILGE